MTIIKLHGFDVTLCQAHLGIETWVQWTPQLQPKFQIYYYLGFDTGKELHFFRTRSNGAVVWVKYSDLYKNNFVPFVLDWKRIKIAFAEETKKSPSSVT